MECDKVKYLITSDSLLQPWNCDLFQSASFEYLDKMRVGIHFGICSHGWVCELCHIIVVNFCGSQSKWVC